MTPQEIKHRFAHHPPANDKVAMLHHAARAKFSDLAVWAFENLDDSRELALVLTNLEEALFWANASIARNQTQL